MSDASDNILPQPHPDFAPSNTSDGVGSDALASRAKNWRPKNTTAETPAATVSRYALRLIDRSTGKAYSADELGVTNAAVAAAIAEDDGSTTWNFGGVSPTTGFGDLSGALLLGDLNPLAWMRPDGSKMGSLYGWDAHSGNGEMVLDSTGRIAIAPGVYGGIQIGLATSGSLQYAYMQKRGSATALDTETDSIPLYFVGTYWNGSASADVPTAGFQLLSTGSGNSELSVFTNSTVPNDLGADGTRNQVAAFTPTGFRDPMGNSPPVVVATDGDTITLACSDEKGFQNHSVTLRGNRTLAFSGAHAGMRGTILVTQDATGSRTLTLPAASATRSGFALTTDPLSTDRIDWFYDGAVYYFDVAANYAIPLDTDAEALLTAASVSTTGTEAKALSRLASRLKAEGLWDTGFACYPFIGTDATGNKQDLFGIYSSGSFGGTVTHTDGITGNGTDGYFLTGFAPADESAQDDLFLYLYCRTELPTDARYLMGATGTGSSRVGLFRSGANLALAGVNANNISGNIGVSSDFRNHLWCQRVSSAQHQIGLGTTAGSLLSVASLNACDRDISILARNDNGTQNQFSSVNIAFAWFGQQLDSTQRTKLFEIVDEYQTALGRANP